jgi:hypothetical protein
VLLKLLKIEDRHRIVFVPGNHDVSWQPVGPEGPELPPTRAEMRRYDESPADAPIRLHVDDQGTLRVYRKSSTEYPRRFQPVHEFLAGFYATCPPSDRFRPFELTNPTVDGHWSAHVFPEQRVAFYGFNTCFHNDRHWRGATLPRAAVVAAAEHANQHAKGYQRVAIWHHGLQAERGHPDFLSLEELGYLFYNGFRIGVHGHTHQDQLRHLEDLLSVRFPIVATGSFGAGPHERPDGYGNQIAVIGLYPTHLEVERFFRLPNNEWKRVIQPPFPLVSDQAPRRDSARAAVHERVIAIDERDGIARVTVRLGDLELDGELTLATPSLDNIQFDAYAQTDDRRIEVTRYDRPRRYTVSAHGRFASLTWSYRVPNVFALSTADLESRERSIWATQLGDDVDGLAHDVRFPCATLRLSLRVVQSLDVADVQLAQETYFDAKKSGVRVFVSSDPASARDREQEARCQQVEAGPVQTTIEVSGPLEGRRYWMTYAPIGGATVATPSVRALVKAVADELRTSIDGGTISEKLNVAVETELRAVFGEAPHVFHVHLWHDEQRELVTSFGRFGRVSFADGFRYGNGVVGNAFRFCRPASYRHHPEKKSLIFEPSRASAPTPDWVVAVPLLVDPTGPAAGVLSFAGSGYTRSMRSWEKQLFAYAESAARTGTAKSEALRKLENQLIAAVTIPFWKTLAALPPTDLAPLHTADAAEIRDRWALLMTAAKQQPLAEGTSVA